MISASTRQPLSKRMGCVRRGKAAQSIHVSAFSCWHVSLPHYCLKKRRGIPGLLQKRDNKIAGTRKKQILLPRSMFRGVFTRLAVAAAQD